MSNRSNRAKRTDRAAYAERRAARERKARIKAAFFQECLFCKIKHRCDKLRTAKCLVKVRARVVSQFAGGEG